MGKIKCNNTLCDYCVRSNTNFKTYMCILDEIKLDISGGKAADSGWDDDVVQCANYEPRYSGKEQEDTQP